MNLQVMQLLPYCRAIPTMNFDLKMEATDLQFAVLSSDTWWPQSKSYEAVKSCCLCTHTPYSKRIFVKHLDQVGQRTDRTTHLLFSNKFSGAMLAKCLRVSNLRH